MTKAVKKKLVILEENIDTLKSKYNVKSIGIFGSFAKGKQTKMSDIDLVVELYRPISFFQFIALEKFLESQLGRKVDLTTKKAIKPAVKEQILKETLYV